MPNYIWSFERYKQALRLSEFVKSCFEPISPHTSAATIQPEIEYNLLDNIIVVGEQK